MKKNKRIGFVGLGNMGKPMSERLLKEDFEVTVYDIRPEPIKELEELGATGASNLKQVAENSDIVFLMVMNYPQVQACTIEEGGLFSGMKPGSHLIIASTIGPSEIKEIAREAAKYDVTVLDVPCTGGTHGAIAGTLTLIIGASDQALEECKEVLSAVGSHLIQVGKEVGAAQVVKAANQILVSVHTVAMAEAMVLGKAAGADPQVLYDVLTKGVATSAIFENKVPSILKGDFSCKGALEILIKDLSICAKLSKELSVPLFASSIARDVFLWATGKGLENEDFSTIIKLYEEIAGVEVRS